MNGEDKLVLVYGATGAQGRAIVARLLKHGHRVRALVRDSSKAVALLDQGVDVRTVDFSDVVALTEATRGVDAVSLLIPVSLPVEDMIVFARATLTATRDARVPHTVVTISSVIPTQTTGKASPDARMTLAQLVSDLVPQSVRLNATLYLENFSVALRSAIEQGVIPQAVPANVRVAYLSLDDLAAFVVAAIERPHLAGQSLHLGGREALTGAQLAAVFSQVTGRPVQYQALPPEAMIPILAPLVGDTIARQVAEMYSWEGTAGSALLAPDLTPTLQALPVALTPIQTWAASALR